MSESSLCRHCGQLAHFKPCSEVNKPRCFCSKPLEISPPIPDGQEADPGQTYNFLCPKHGDATNAESNYRRMVEAEAERDRLRDYQERTGPIMAYLAMMVPAYDTDPGDPLDDVTEISSFCASGASGALTVGMVRKALEAKT